MIDMPMPASNIKRVFLLIAGASAAAAACTSDLDCSLNGRCTKAGRCECIPAWKGEQCELMHLLGTTPPGAGYRYKTLGGPETSWGGGVLRDDSGTYHMWAAELINHCSMGDWLANSQVVHATSKSLTGPFKRQEVVWPVFAHEPNTVRAPTGEYVMYWTATRNHKIPTMLSKSCECRASNQGKQLRCNGERDWSVDLLTYMSYTTDPNGGNWSAPVEIPQEAPLIDSNFAPVIMPDGSLIGLFRDDGNHTSPKSKENMHIVTATNWRDPKTYKESSEPISGGVVGQAGPDSVFDAPEDPFVWR